MHFSKVLSSLITPFQLTYTLTYLFFPGIFYVRSVCAFKQAVDRKDTSGLYLPNDAQAVQWLHSFYETANPYTEWIPGAEPSWNYALATLENKNHPPASLGGPGCDRKSGSPDDDQGGDVAHKTNVLIAPVGEDWSADLWMSNPKLANFDIIGIYYGSAPENFTCEKCAQLFSMVGPKWRLYWALTSNSTFWGPIAKRYRYVMLPDDDLIMDTCTINAVFDTMRAYDLLVAQPSVCQVDGSSTWQPLLYQRPGYHLRFTTFVEIMSPAYRMDFFDKVVRHAFDSRWTFVGWGLDSLIPALLHYPKDRVAVIDRVCMSHPPAPGGMGAGSKKEYSVYRPGLSPFSPTQEEYLLYNYHRYTGKTVANLGESFRSAHVLGSVKNVDVVASMQMFNQLRTIRWIPSHILGLRIFLVGLAGAGAFLMIYLGAGMQRRMTRVPSRAMEGKA